MEKITFEDIKREVKRREIKEKIDNGIVYCMEHKMEALGVLALGVEGLKTIGKMVNSHNRKVEEKEKRNRIYDHRRRRYYYYETPKKWQEEEINYRESKGERYIDILRDMGLIKK